MHGTTQITDHGFSALRAPVRAPSPRIVFLVMSAVAQPATVDQLAQALKPHTVLVHHDFKQTPQFNLRAENARFVPDPVPTGWAQFGFVEGIFRGLHHALSHLDFDYLQLLSPTCLPIKPVQEFERHVNGRHDAHFDALRLSEDLDARLSVGYRAWTREGSLTHRLARRLVNVYYGDSLGRRDEAGIWLRTGRSSSRWAALAAWPLQLVSRRHSSCRLGGQSLPLYYGSVWFGARRSVVDKVVRAYRHGDVREHFSRMHIAEEFLLPSLLMRARPQRGAMNHLIARFDGAHPGVLGLEQLEALRRSTAWFARKFADDAQAPARQAVLHQLARARFTLSSCAA